MVSVALFGAGPGLYFDLSRLSFQVPTLLSAPQAITVRARTATRTTVEVRKNLLRMFLLLCGGIIPRGGRWGVLPFLLPLYEGRILDAGDVKEGGGDGVSEEDAE